MNILSQLTRQNIRRNRTRSLAALGGIFLAAAMFTILTTTVISLWDYVRRGTEYETGDYFVSADFVDETGVEAAKNDPLIRRITDLRVTGYYGQFELIAPGSTYPVAAVDNAFFKEMTVPLKEGRLPENSSEILIPEQINLVCLQQGWKTWKIGESVSLDLFDLRKAKTVEENGWSKQYRPDETESQEYRIVGITRNKAYSDDENDWGAYCLLTLADGAEGDTLWHRLFFKTAPKDAAAVLARHYGQKSFQNSDLLRVYGMGGIEQGTAIMLVIILAALLIVAALSVVLIRSIFSVSVTERTREFGLLASIGTTPKQIRSLVRREALFFLVTALPLGLAAGVLGAGGLLARYRGILINQFSFGESVPVSVRLSPAALIAASLICALTVFLSVSSPARWASRIIPLEAIRQNRDIRIREKKWEGSGRISRLLGIPGWVGTRYERVAGKKYRAVTAALAFSLILFLPAVFLAGLAEKQADAYTEDFDFSLYSAGGSIDSAILEKLRAEPEISFSVLLSAKQFYSSFLTSDLPEEYRAVHMGTAEQKDYSSLYSYEEVHVTYIEDSVFAAALKAEGIDPKPYLTGDAYFAVIVPFSVGGFAVPDETGGWSTVIYEGYGAGSFPEEMLCITLGIPHELTSPPGESMPPEWAEYLSTDDGKLLLKKGNKTYLLEWEAKGDSGIADVVYRNYNMSTGEAGTPAAEADLPYLRIHPLQYLKKTPDGCGNTRSISLVMPLSKQADEQDRASLGIRVRNLSDYYSLLAKLKALVEENPLLVYTDHREDSVNQLGIAAMIRGIATGFLILISLLCGVNVFYTLSTNIVLRRRDFGILQSIGFTRKDLLRMVTAENIRSCARALLFGIPMGIGLCFILEKLTSRGVSSGFQPPWNALLLGAGVILLLMVLSTLYGLRLLKKTTPIEAIREENI
jgi:putative ABC transport system permease protein